MNANHLSARRRGISLRQVFRSVCHFVGAHPDVAATSNAFDKGTIVAQALVLALAVTLAVVAWSAFLSTFSPVIVALPGALLVAAMIGLLDRFMISSDWNLSGVLSEGRPPVSWWARLAARVGVAWIFAQATAIGLTLYVFAGAIEDQLQRDRVAANAPLVQEYGQRKDDERRRTVDALEGEVATLQEERERLLQENQQVTALRRESTAQARAAANEVGRELDGYEGRMPGPGPRWREAQRLASAAREAAQEADAELQRNQARLDELNVALEARTRELRTMVSDRAIRDAALDAEMQQDPRWVSARRGPLSAYLGLTRLKNDRDYGPTVRFFSGLFVTVLMALELSVLLVKTIFAPPSVYTVRLIERTKREAITVVAEEQEATRQVIRSHRPRGRLRLVDADGNAQDREAGNG